jgi:hypothetical protein
MKNEFFMQKKRELPSATLFVIPSRTLLHELHKNGEIDILQTKSCDNLADLFTKSLTTVAFQNAFMTLV